MLNGCFEFWRAFQLFTPTLDTLRSVPGGRVGRARTVHSHRQDGVSMAADANATTSPASTPAAIAEPEPTMRSTMRHRC